MIVPGLEDGHVVYVLYREPKLVAIALGISLLVTALAWTRPEILRWSSLRDLLRQPALRLGGLLLAWLLLTGLWGRVPANYVYEALQYVTLAVLLVALLSWVRRDERVLSTVGVALVASVAVVSLVGLLQLSGLSAFGPWLTPIDPEIGVAHASLMGYKNPAALAVLGQIFVLAGLALRSRTQWVRWSLSGLLLLELLYVATLRSRTAYLALAVGLLYLVLLALSRPGARRFWRSALVVAAVCGVLLASVAMSSERVRQRLQSVGELLSEPTLYLETDRGTYLRNTVHMARHNPLGVGLGDWQTYYPVYRRYNREVAFSLQFQARRAHSDHVQVLGEAGWPGAVLWGTWWLVLIGGTARAYRCTGDLSRLFVSTQLAAVTVAMATDYLAEMPYHKLQLTLLAFLALAPPSDRNTGSEADMVPKKASPTRARKLRSHWPALTVTVLALAYAAYSFAFLAKVRTSARMHWHYETVLTELARDGRGEAARLFEVLRLGERFEALPSATKTLHRDYLILADSARRLGRIEAARHWGRKAVATHPYSPNALLLMSRLANSRDEAADWRETLHYVMEQADSGFDRDYPLDLLRE